MATKPEDFPNSIPGDANYPDGSALDEQTPGLFDGFPLKAAWLNDFFAFFQKMASVAGIALNGTVDTVLSSQFFESLLKVIDGSQIVIRTQVEFDAYFDGSGTKTGNIYLAEVGIIYQHNNDVTFGSNFKLDGDNGVLIEKASATAKFNATGTPDNVHFTDNVTYDGKKATYTVTTSGGFAVITGCINSRFEINIIDSKTSVNGGAYFATSDTNKNCTVKNISGCEAVSGGGVYGAYNSEISNVTDCVGNGVVHTCHKSLIYNIYDNGSSGVQDCEKSFIFNIYGNFSAGVEGSHNSNISNIYANAAGVFNCLESTISNIYENNNDGVIQCGESNISNVHHNGIVSAGIGVTNCPDSTIDNIHDNPEGGVIGSDRCNISNIQDNTGTTTGAGGCNSCDNCSFTGVFRGNTSPTGSFDHIANCLTSIAFILGDGTTDVKISTIRETINF